MARVLLISPNLKGIKDGANRIQPGLGVGYLAGVLEQRGHTVFVRDTALEGYMNVTELEDGRTILIGESESDIRKYVIETNPDVVGISILFSNLADHAHTTARIVKEAKPGVTVVLGGNHVTNAASDYLAARLLVNESKDLESNFQEFANPDIDFALTGECDFTFADLVEDLSEDRDPTGIAGLVYHHPETGELVFNPTSERIDVKTLPHPARHLMNMEGYFSIGKFHSIQSHSERVLNVMAARGCPEKCTFCTTPDMWGAKVRWRDPQDIYEEIRSCIEEFDIGEVQFEDDTLTANLPNLLQLCDLLEPLGIPWCTPNGTKLNYHRNKQPEMFRRMREAGCYQITLACESGVQRVMDEIIGKRLQIEEIRPAIANAKAAGLLVHTFWIVGFPGETRQEMERTIEVAAESGADSFSVSILTPLPGTPIYRQVVREQAWWDPEKGIQDMIYRNSLVRVDGFDTSLEFENWVNEQNAYLNSLLEKNDPERAAFVHASRGARHLSPLKLKQT